MAVWHAGKFASPGLYYDVERDKCVRVPPGGAYLVGCDGAHYLRLPSWSLGPLAVAATGAFRLLLPLSILVAIVFGVCWQLSRALGRLWCAALRFVRLYPEPRLAYLTPQTRGHQPTWLDELEREVLAQDQPSKRQRLDELEREVRERRREET